MKIAVVGSINIDQSVETDRIPRKGETIAGQSLKYTPGGKGANQAVAMGRLGAEVVFFGCVGDDANGKAMLENLESQGVSTTHIQTIENVPTGIALITVRMMIIQLLLSVVQIIMWISRILIKSNIT